MTADIAALARALHRELATRPLGLSAPYHIQPPWNAHPFDLSARFFAATANQWTPVLTVQVPPDHRCRISAYYAEVVRVIGAAPDPGPFPYAGSLRWRILISGVARYRHLESWSEPRGTAAEPRTLVLCVEGNDIVQFQAWWDGTGAHRTADLGLLGWTWPHVPQDQRPR